MKKRPREWWLYWPEDKTIQPALCEWKGRAEEYVVFHSGGEVIQLREVLPKRRKKK